MAADDVLLWSDRWWHDSRRMGQQHFGQHPVGSVWRATRRVIGQLDILFHYVLFQSPSTEYCTRYLAQGNTDLVPDEGATGTPVIDLATGSIDLATFPREVVAGVSANYYHRIHALNITNSNEQPYSPGDRHRVRSGHGCGRQRHHGDVCGHPAFAAPDATLAGGPPLRRNAAKNYPLML